SQLNSKARSQVVQCLWIGKQNFSITDNRIRLRDMTCSCPIESGIGMIELVDYITGNRVGWRVRIYASPTVNRLVVIFCRMRIRSAGKSLPYRFVKSCGGIKPHFTVCVHLENPRIEWVARKEFGLLCE